MLLRYQGRHLRRRPVRRGPAVVTTAAAMWSVGSAAAHAATHVVKPGETLSSIASRYGTSWQHLAATNDLADPNLIVAGQGLRIPVGVALSGSHTVRPGETLSSIASRYGASVNTLARANHLADANFIIAGSTLKIPGAPAPAPVAASAASVESSLERHAAAVGVDPSLVKAVAWQESGWRQDIVSEAGAIGVMQVMPDTADFVNEVLGEGALDVNEADDNVRLGVRYLRHLLDSMPTEKKALAAYVSGPGNVRHRLSKEQRRYVAAVLSHRD
jgi:N-acetylmuramoyl-L-alanine amidase